MRRLLLALALSALAGPTLADPRHGMQVPAGNYAVVTANPSAPIRTLQTQFEGLDFDTIYGGLWNYLGQTPAYFTTSDTNLIALLKTLGPNGRASMQGRGPQISKTPAGNTELQALHDFWLAVGNGGNGWLTNFSWGLSAPGGYSGTDLSNAVTEVGRIEAIFGHNNTTYFVSCEPDNTSLSGFTTPASFIAAYDAYKAAIQAAYPWVTHFAGPEITDSVNPGSGWLAAFVAAEPGADYASEHYYTNFGASTPGMLMRLMMERVGGAPSVNRTIQDLAAVSPMPIASDQDGTSYVSGGPNGLVNAAISADWYVALVIQMANSGWSFINLEGGLCVPAYYTPINGASAADVISGAWTTDCSLKETTAWFVGPIWAGMELAWGIGGSQVLPVTQAGSGAYITVLGLLGVDGKTSLLIANLDAVNSVSIIPRSTASWSTATATVVGSASPSDLTVNINGIQMSPTTGLCVSTCPPTTYAKGASITLPAGSAMLVKMQ